MARVILTLLITMGIVSCKPTQSNELELYLSNKYNEEFVIINDTYNHILKVFEFRASPKNNPNMVFGGEHNKDFTYIKDKYATEYMSHTYTKLIKAKIEKFISPIYVYTDIVFNDEVYEQENIKVEQLNIDTAIDTCSMVFFNLTCYLFSPVTEKNKDEALKGLYEVIKRFESHPEAFISLHLYIWEPEFSDNNPLDILEFDRLKYSYPHVAHRDLLLKHVTHRLDFYLNTNQAHKEHSTDTFYENLHEVDANNFEVTPANMNILK